MKNKLKKTKKKNQKNKNNDDDFNDDDHQYDIELKLQQKKRNRQKINYKKLTKITISLLSANDRLANLPIAHHHLYPYILTSIHPSIHLSKCVHQSLSQSFYMTFSLSDCQFVCLLLYCHLERGKITNNKNKISREKNQNL